MNKIVSFVLLLTILSNVAFADCDFSSGITLLPNGNFEYSRECHLKVGQIKSDLGIANKQITDLNTALQLKDLALKKSDERVELWMGTTYKLEDRVSKIDELGSKNNLLYFGLGALTVIGAGFMAGKLIHN